MTDQLTIEEALDIIRSAFLPLRCVAESTDYQYFRFRVFNDENNGILKAPKLTEADIGAPKALEKVILRARSMVEEQGFVLAPWAMPPRPASAAPAI